MPSRFISYLSFEVREIPSPDPDRYDGPITVCGPLWVSERDMKERIKRGSEEDYWNLVAFQGYRPEPMFTVAGLSRLDKAAARRLRESSMCLGNPLGSNFLHFKLQMFSCLPFDESGLVYWAWKCPSDVRILQDVTSAGTVPFLRQYCEAIGEAPTIPLDSWALFHPVADTWDLSVPVFQDYHLCLLSERLIKEGFHLLHGRTFRIEWQGGELKSFESLCLENLQIPLISEVSCIYPFDAYLFGILRTDVRKLVYCVTQHSWINRNVRTADYWDRILRHERRRLLTAEERADRRFARQARQARQEARQSRREARQVRHEANRARRALRRTRLEVEEMNRRINAGFVIEAPSENKEDELATFLEQDYVVTVAPFGCHGSQPTLGATGAP